MHRSTDLHYYHGVEHDISKSLVDIDFNKEHYVNILQTMLNAYITSSADYKINSTVGALSPTYMESFDLYFSSEFTQDAMRDVLFKKTDNTYNHFIGQFEIDEFIKNQISSPINTIDEINNTFIKLLAKSDQQDYKIISVMVKAKREIMINKNYKYALLECFTYLDSYLTQFLTECKIRSEVSRSKIQSFDTEVGISYKLNIELPIFISPTDYIREVIGKVDKVRKKRNDIIHNTRDNETVTKQDAIGAAESIYELHQIISTKRKELGL